MQSAVEIIVPGFPGIFCLGNSTAPCCKPHPSAVVVPKLFTERRSPILQPAWWGTPQIPALERWKRGIWSSKPFLATHIVSLREGPVTTMQNNKTKLSDNSQTAILLSREVLGAFDNGLY